MTLPTASKQAKPLSVDLGQSDQLQSSGRIVLLYGDSGLGKSTNARFFAQYEYERTRLPGILVTAEDSSKTIFQPLIDAGIVQPFFISKVKHPLVYVRKLTTGQIPFEDNGKEAWRPSFTPGVYGFAIFEGLTTFGEGILEQMREEHRFLREQKGDAFEIAGEKFATASQTAYGFAQMEMLRALKASGMLPVDRVLWTAHETSGQEEDTRAPLRGPAIVGSAATDRIKKYVGLMLHVEKMTKEERVNNEKIIRVYPRIYFRNHPDPKFPNIFYPAKTTIPVEKQGELDKRFPGGYFEPGTQYGEGLDKFLKVEEELVRSSADDVKKWKESLGS